MKWLLLFTFIGFEFACEQDLRSSFLQVISAQDTPSANYRQDLISALVRERENLGETDFFQCYVEGLSEGQRDNYLRIVQFHQLFELEPGKVMDRVLRELNTGENAGVWIDSPVSPFGQVYLKWVEANATYNQFLDIQVATFSCTPLDGVKECFQVDIFRTQPLSLVERKYFDERLLWDVSHIPDGNYKLRLRWRNGMFHSPDFQIAHQ